jgi:hypothetical protein
MIKCFFRLLYNWKEKALKNDNNDHNNGTFLRNMLTGRLIKRLTDVLSFSLIKNYFIFH